MLFFLFQIQNADGQLRRTTNSYKDYYTRAGIFNQGNILPNVAEENEGTTEATISKNVIDPSELATKATMPSASDPDTTVDSVSQSQGQQQNTDGVTNRQNVGQFSYGIFGNTQSGNRYSQNNLGKRSADTDQNQSRQQQVPKNTEGATTRQNLDPFSTGSIGTMQRGNSYSGRRGSSGFNFGSTQGNRIRDTTRTTGFTSPPVTNQFSRGTTTSGFNFGSADQGTSYSRNPTSNNQFTTSSFGNNQANRIPTRTGTGGYANRPNKNNQFVGGFQIGSTGGTTRFTNNQNSNRQFSTRPSPDSSGFNFGSGTTRANGDYGYGRSTSGSNRNGIGLRSDDTNVNVVPTNLTNTVTGRNVGPTDSNNVIGTRQGFGGFPFGSGNTNRRDVQGYGRQIMGYGRSMLVPRSDETANTTSNGNVSPTNPTGANGIATGPADGITDPNNGVGTPNTANGNFVNSLSEATGNGVTRGQGILGPTRPQMNDASALLPSVASNGQQMNLGTSSSQDVTGNGVVDTPIDTFDSAAGQTPNGRQLMFGQNGNIADDKESTAGNMESRDVDDDDIPTPNLSEMANQGIGQAPNQDGKTPETLPAVFRPDSQIWRWAPNSSGQRLPGQTFLDPFRHPFGTNKFQQRPATFNQRPRPFNQQNNFNRGTVNQQTTFNQGTSNQRPVQNQQTNNRIFNSQGFGMPRNMTRAVSKCLSLLTISCL